MIETKQLNKDEFNEFMVEETMGGPPNTTIPPPIDPCMQRSQATGSSSKTKDEPDWNESKSLMTIVFTNILILAVILVGFVTNEIRCHRLKNEHEKVQHELKNQVEPLFQRIE